MNVKEKETYDYVACLSKLADSSSGSQYIILMEDDMWIKPTFLEHIERLLNFYSAYPDPKWAFTKLFYPDQHKGFELTFWSVLELVTSSVIIGAISAVLWRAVTGTRRRHLPFSKLTPLHIFNVLLILVMLNRQHTLIPLYHVVHPFKHDIPHGSSSGAILWSKKHANNMYDYVMAMPNMNKEIDFILNDFVRDNNLSAYSLEYNVFDHIGYESSISNNKRGAKHFLRY
ncbi:uncharacterized protein LOC131892136 isoform X2 [Tigriopus californicus]|nr:uncharacterized protein LOC131892136 isoform X2 [Tigriopus californicus]